ncbi:hypothetical protein [Herbaspirillum rhizosphaerae]|uniref:hypothetical protein n=1 Tax=Herbaspirillum rhizosphaerae TaxID=346179 RepID=UPI00067D03FE|nr:hypothetical protein [Herbaspirillum rhizosphaerae]
MGTLHLDGTLKLSGALTLEGKVLSGGKEVLVALAPPKDAPHSKTASPADPLSPDGYKTSVWAAGLPSVRVNIRGKVIVVSGAPCQQGVTPAIVGVVDAGAGTVTIDGLAVARTGASATMPHTVAPLDNSGQT